MNAPRPAAAPATERCAAWYAEHGGRLYRYLRFHAPSADVAEELLAETFLRAVEAADRYDAARGPALHWLLTIARNVLRDEARRAARRPVAPSGALRDLVHEGPSPEEQMLFEEQVATLLAAVAGLPEADRELLSLRYGSDLSMAEIGERLGVREAAVRTRLWRVLGRLRTVMAAS